MRAAASSAILLLVATSTFAQYDCSVSRYGNNALTGQTVTVSQGSGWIFGGENSIDHAVGRWNNDCGSYAGGSGFGFPSLAFNSGTGPTATVNFHNGRAPSNVPNCGATVTFSDSSGNPTGWVIEIWAADRNGISCDPIQDTITHELGHVMGLADVSYASNCFGSIMGARAPGGTRTITSSDCYEVGDTWYTTSEEQADQQSQQLNSCSMSCWTSCNWSGGGAECPPTWQSGCCSPILIDLDEDKFHLVGVDDLVSFDIDDDGDLDRITWTASGEGDAFLALDRNYNGTIDNGAELFGSYTRMSDGTRALNGYLALAEFDRHDLGGNGDGRIDRDDAVWPFLRVWTDANHNGTSERTELQPLDAAGVAAFSCKFERLGYTDRHGNIFRFKGKAWLTRDHGNEHPTNTYDVFFVRP